MGAGNNLGIREAQGKYILILNPDIYILDKAIDNLYNFIKVNPQIGLVAPKLLNPDRTLQPTCYRWYGALTPLYRRTIFGKLPRGKKDLQRFLMTDYDHRTPREVDWCQGSCFMVPKKVFAEVGVFDENYFMYFEDTDLCRRIWRAGYKVFYLATTSVVHMHMKMSQGGLMKIFSNKLIRAHIRSWFLFLKKYRKKNI